MLATAARPGAVSLLLGLLGQVHRALPAPVDKDPDQEPPDKGAGTIDSKGREPRELRNERPFGGRAAENPRQGYDGEEQERADLGDDQDVLEVGRELGAYDAHGRHRDDDDHGEQRDRHLRAGEAVETEEQVGVACSHVGQRPHDQDAGNADGPAPDPTGPRSHGPRHPRERRAAVLVGAVHVVESGGHEEHRYERSQQNRRRLHTDGDHHQPDDGRQRVGRRRRGYADDQGVPETYRVAL